MQHINFLEKDEIHLKFFLLQSIHEILSRLLLTFKKLNLAKIFKLFVCFACRLASLYMSTISIYLFVRRFVG